MTLAFSTVHELFREAKLPDLVSIAVVELIALSLIGAVVATDGGAVFELEAEFIIVVPIAAIAIESEVE